MKFLLYCQHLSGAGHFVRTYEIARALAEGHDVHLVDGGRRVPRTLAPISLVELPRIRRDGDGLAPLEAGLALDEVMRERARLLRAARARIDPDVIVVEHFPFSKNSLGGEILPFLEGGRARVFCSLRDLAARTRTDPVSPEATRRVLDRFFDGVLVHADPALTREHDGIGELSVPVTYTGIVSERPPASSPSRDIVVSAGGAGSEQLARTAIEAWRESGLQDHPLVLCGTSLPAAPQLANLHVEPFGTRFLRRLAGAALSISEAGYNTCANLLATRVAAILVPRARFADQRLRSRILEERGLVRVLPAERLDAPALAAAMRDALGRRMPEHGLDLDGARRTRDLLLAARAR